jgi:hypothetical protein
MKLILLIGLFCMGSVPVLAVTLPPVPTGPIYYEPEAELTEAIMEMSCVTLDQNINQLHPYRYSYKEKFYYDSANQLASSLILFDSIQVLGLAYLGYSSLVEEKEQRRMLLIQQKINVLQQAKAYKRCFE